MSDHRESHSLLPDAVRRAEGDGFYLASLLAEYRELESMDDASLARHLGCLPDLLPVVALCRRPHTEAPMFRRDIKAIADRFGLRADRLADLVRMVDSVREMSSAGHGTTGLIAARDREQEAADGTGKDSHPDGREDAES